MASKWGPGTRHDPHAPTEQAFAFISKSILDVRRNAATDLKLMQMRARRIQQFANQLDDWENIKVPLGSGNDVAAGKLLKTLRDSSRKALARPPALEELELFKNLKQLKESSRKALARPPPVMEELELFKNLKEHVPPSFRRVQSDPNLARPKSHRKLVPVSPRQFNARQLIRLDEWDAAKRGQKWTIGGEWEPLRKMKEGLKELETTAATSKTPSEFFTKVKENIKARSPRERHLDAEKVPPLDVPELLESLVRQSEPILDQLGVKKGLSTKVCNLLRSCKKRGRRAEEHPTSCGICPLGGAAEAPDELVARMASVVQSTGYRGSDSALAERAEEDAGAKKHHIAIVTTASLPWMTGTAVNPLLRAAYLARSGEQAVTLLVPWLSRRDQESVYPDHITFDTPAEQEAYVREWLRTRVGFTSDLKISFYPGKFSQEKRSILAVGDISQFISDREADVAVLEEPEHLTWYYHGKRWSQKFQHVVGIVHTNYLEYVRREKNGALQAALLEHINNWMVRAYCHKVVRLSAATQAMPRAVVMNVHGVGSKFLEVGEKVVEQRGAGEAPFGKGAYYLGKMVWSKGYRELVDLLASHQKELEGLPVDVYGTGEDSAAVQAAAQRHNLRMKFHKGRDHADPSLHQYKVFINPSLSDVVCTTTAEALAMGKIVVCADHPSNEFFRQFPNCYPYTTNEEFVQQVQKAMAAEPAILTPEQRHLLTWEAANDRFLDVSGIKSLPPRGARKKKPKLFGLKALPLASASAVAAGDKGAAPSPLKSPALPDPTEIVDKCLAFVHFMASGIEPWRRVGGALPGTMHCGPDLSKDLGLPPPWAQRPVYGW